MLYLTPAVRACVLSISLVACASHVAHAQDQAQTTIDMPAIEQAWANGDFILVRQGLEQLANDPGDALAQYRFGRVLIEGRGGPQDIEAGKSWLQKAVDQGNNAAATLLARVLLSDPDQTDPKPAADLFAGAAARGDAEAQYYLGLLHKAGRGVAQDDKVAFNWFLAASEGGNTQAKWELSQAFANGRGTAQSAKNSLRWMQEAATEGQPDAQYFLGVAYDQGSAIEPNSESALAWYRRAAEGGQILAQRTLGTIYLQGTHDQAVNGQEAARWLTSAARAGDPGAMYNLGIGLASGAVLPRDDAQAKEWFIAASNARLGRATFAVGQFHEAGRAGPVNMEQAVAFYVTAAREGYKPAALRLGSLTSSGALDDVVAPHTAVPWALLDLQETGSAQAQAWLEKQADAGVRPALAAYGGWLVQQENHASEGAAMLERAATGGDVDAQFQLGTMLTTGTGVDLDYVAAHAWLNIAAASGHSEAAETRDLIGDLMTPDQVAEAQTRTRVFFEQSASRVPQTSQTVTKTAPTQAPAE